MSKLLVMTLVGAPSLALAETPLQKLDLAFVIGNHQFASDTELGAESMNGPGPRDSALIGGRLGFRFTPAFAGELEIVVMPTRDDVLDESATVYGFRAQARVDLFELASARPLAGKLGLFALAGAGVHRIEGGAPQLSDDTDACYQWGGALSYAFSDRFGLRLDVRHLLVPDRREDGATDELEVTAGLAIRFAGAASPPPPRDAAVAPPPARVESPEVVLSALPPIEFDVRDAAVRAETRPILDRVVDVLQQHPGVRVEIAGHTSTDGAEAANLDLSIDRAREVQRYLRSRGIAADRMTVVGHGASQPIAGNETELGRARNRRIEIRVLGR